MIGEGHTKDEVASIGPYTNYSTLLLVIPIYTNFGPTIQIYNNPYHVHTTN